VGREQQPHDAHAGFVPQGSEHGGVAGGELNVFHISRILELMPIVNPQRKKGGASAAPLTSPHSDPQLPVPAA